MNSKFISGLLGSIVVLSGCGGPSPTVSSDQLATQSPSPVPTTATQPSDSTSSTSAQSQGDITVKRVQFAPGANSAVVEDSIRGYQTIDYILGAKAGQYMNVSMATDNGANYFNILAPGENDVAMFNGSVDDNQYEGTLPASGDYKVRVYLMRSAARENQVANYRLEMVIGASNNGAATSSGSANPNDAKVPGTEYNATGNIPCTTDQTASQSSCPFGVVRQGNGNGIVDVTRPDGITISVFFENGQAVKAQGGSGAFSSAKQGDESVVTIGTERFTIPDAVIFGG